MTGMLYDLPGHKNRAMEHTGGALTAASRMQAGSTTTTKGPGKTAGRAIMNAAGGASLASTLGASMTGAGLAGPQGLLLGAAVGLGSYLLS